MKKIIVGIPSYNEAKRIGFVVKQIDRGLTKIFNPKNCLIVNLDGKSPDNTKEEFMKVKTACSKEYIPVSKGKGYGLLKFWQYALSENATGAATLDADIKSITPTWIYKLLNPIVNKECDVVVPLYTRNRFSGGITNHFAYPLIYSLYGFKVRQPLAGEHGYSLSFIKYLLKQSKSQTSFKYGIDFYITANALFGKFRMLIRELGQKIEKPGFAHQKRTLLEVSQSAIFTTRNHLYNWGDNHNNSSFVSIEGNTLGIDKAEQFSHKRAIPHLFKTLREDFENYKQIIKVLLKEEYTMLQNIIRSDNAEFTSQLWTDILLKILLKCYSPQFEIRDIPLMASILLPIYRRRVISFWLSVEGVDPQIAEEIINRQAELLHKKFNKEKLISNLRERR